MRAVIAGAAAVLWCAYDRAHPALAPARDPGPPRVFRKVGAGHVLDPPPSPGLRRHKRELFLIHVGNAAVSALKSYHISVAEMARIQSTQLRWLCVLDKDNRAGRQPTVRAFPRAIPIARS